MIKAYLKGEQTGWDRNLGCLAAAYRASMHESTGMTPNLLMLGREVRLPSEIVFGSGTTRAGEQITSYGQYVDSLRSRMQHAHEIARKHLKNSAQQQKQNYNFKAHVHKYQQGELVWVLSDRSQQDVTPKLRRPYEGPFLILKQINDLIYLVQFNAKGKKQILHHNGLKPYLGSGHLKWANKAVKSFLRSTRA